MGGEKAVMNSVLNRLGDVSKDMSKTHGSEAWGELSLLETQAGGVEVGSSCQPQRDSPGEIALGRQMEKESD